MIHAKDWLIFLENGVSLEELPLSEEHKNFCLAWLKKRENPNKATLDFDSYPPKVFKRAELWTDYDAYNDASTVWNG